MSNFQWSNITYTFRWIAVGDNRTCSKCMALNGQEIEGNPYSPTLNHPQFGPIWDFQLDLPLTHGGTPHNCRCQLEVYATVHWSEIEPIQDLCSTFEVTMKDETVSFPMGTTITDMKNEMDELQNKILRNIQTYQDLLRLERTLNNILRMAESMSGGDPNLVSLINQLQRLLRLMQAIQAAYVALQIARMSMGDPLAWASALTSLTVTGASIVSDFSMEIYAH